MNNQDTNQPEVVEPVTDTKPTDSTQDTTVPDTVKLELSADQAEMVQDLLSNYVYAYRSDREVNYKRELVSKDKVGKYPYVAEPADPSIINPTYDWVNKKWYSKSGSTSLPEIAQVVKTLQNDQQNETTQNLTLTKAAKALSEGQASQNKLLASMQKIILQMASQKQAASTETTDTKQENGGN